MDLGKESVSDFVLSHNMRQILGEIIGQIQFQERICIIFDSGREYGPDSILGENIGHIRFWEILLSDSILGRIWIRFDSDREYGSYWILGETIG